MNARQLKAAFVFRSRVSVDEKNSTVHEGHVIELIYSLSQNGKKQCSGVVQPWEAHRKPLEVPCRHIHFISKEKKPKLPNTEPNDHTKEITQAFLNVLPVIVKVPNVSTVRGYIRNIVYWRNPKGNIQCSADVIDKNCTSCVVRARLKYINIETDSGRDE